MQHNLLSVTTIWLPPWVHVMLMMQDGSHQNCLENELLVCSKWLQIYSSWLFCKKAVWTQTSPELKGDIVSFFPLAWKITKSPELHMWNSLEGRCERLFHQNKSEKYEWMLKYCSDLGVPESQCNGIRIQLTSCERQLLGTSGIPAECLRIHVTVLRKTAFSVPLDKYICMCYQLVIWSRQCVPVIPSL